MRTDDVVGKAQSELTFNHKLVEGNHARDLVRPSVAKSVAAGETLRLLFFPRLCRVTFSRLLFRKSLLSRRALRFLLTKKLFVRVLLR